MFLSHQTKCFCRYNLRHEKCRLISFLYYWKRPSRRNRQIIREPVSPVLEVSFPDAARVAIPFASAVNLGNCCSIPVAIHQRWPVLIARPNLDRQIDSAQTVNSTLPLFL